MKIENRSFTASEIAEIFASNDDAAVIGGYASVFYDGTERTECVFTGNVYNPRTRSSDKVPVYERILRGAFDDVIRSCDTVALFNHNPDFILGRTTAGTLTLTVDDKGLRFECKPVQSGETIRIVSNIQRKEVAGCSFSFANVKDRFVKEQRNGKTVYVRSIERIGKLFDVGPVTYPAYKSTNISVRSQGDNITIYDINPLDFDILEKDIRLRMR